MYFDRFDIVSAYYHFFIGYHAGQYSRKYERLSKIMSYYRPSLSDQHADNMTENAREIYNQLVEGN